MNVMRWIGRLLFVGGALLPSLCMCGSASSVIEQGMLPQSSLIQTLHAKGVEVIKHEWDMPELNPEVASLVKAKMSEIWETLVEEEKVEVRGADKEARPYFVMLQGVLEHLLASELQNEIKGLQGFIHTPMPTTALCTTRDLSKELVDPLIENDPPRLCTVRARTQTVRNFLLKGGKLYVVYPKDGDKKRTQEQQEIYKEALRNYPTHLVDLPLNCETMPVDLIGATYLFQDQLKNTFVFSIKMTQANNPKDLGHFALWFGPIHSPSIQERLRDVSNYMQQNGSYVLEEVITDAFFRT